MPGRHTPIDSITLASGGREPPDWPMVERGWWGEQLPMSLAMDSDVRMCSLMHFV